MIGEASYKIPFTQYMRPNGRPVPVLHITHRADVFDKAGKITAEGFSFEIETLTTGEVSATIGDEHGDYAHIVCANTSEAHVRDRIGDMIMNFDIERGKRERKAYRD